MQIKEQETFELINEYITNAIKEKKKMNFLKVILINFPTDESMSELNEKKSYNCN